MPHDIRDYYSLFTEKGIARPNRFQVVISLPRRLISKFGSRAIREISLLVESSEIPDRSVDTIDYRAANPGYQAVIGQSYQPWNVRFRLMDDFLVKEVLDAWQDLIIDPNTQHVGFRSDYVVEASVTPLDVNNQAIKTYILRDVFPLTVDVISLDNSQENTYMTVGVVFSYRKWN